MLPDTPPMPRVTIVLAVLTGLAVAVPTWLSGPAQSATDDNPSRAAGAAADADRALLVALRQFGLWAVPVGQQARQKAATAAVRSTGGSLATDLDTLSAPVLATADRLGVTLPSQPTGQQRAWSARISSSSGAGYDRVAVDRLRSGCAATRAVIDQAEAQTHDEQVHRLAEQAAAMLDRHLWSLDHLQPTP